MKSAFTIIELIFIITIIGILSTVIFPQLVATRDDAKISKLSIAIQTFHSELKVGIASTNIIPQTRNELEEISNVLKDSSPDYAITIINGKTIQFIDTDHGSEICKVLTINDDNISRITLDFSDGDGRSSVCTGVRGLIPNTSSNFVLAGNLVQY